MPLIVALVLVGLVGWGSRHDIPPFPAVERAAGRARPWVVAYLTSAPATFLYLLVVATTASVIGSSRSEVDEELLRGHSSNLAALAQDPLHGLVQSAFWVEGWTMFLVALVLAVALAPVERWLGTTRWLVVFLLGHVVTSLCVAGALWVAIDTGRASPGLRDVVDVGVSYGFAAIAGVFAHRLPRRLAVAYAAVVAGALLVALAVSGTFTDLGHLIAFAIGLACLPLTRTAPVRARARLPVVPRPAGEAGAGAG